MTEYGLRTTAPGFITPPEAQAWFSDLQAKVAAKRGKSFGLIVDIRGQKANPPETQAIINKAMQWLKQNGLQRSVVVLDSAVARVQIMRIAKETGMYEYERYMDASKDTKWEEKALAWIVHGTDPDASAT
jgi:hypothetical protein